jgi:hypothetical protein
MPLGYQKWVEELLVMSGSRKSPKGFFNYILSFSFALGFLAAVFVKSYFLVVWFGIFIGLFLLFHGFLVLAVERRTSFVENILPDALQLMAANSRAGYIPSRAFLLSARKEFGPLSDAIRRVAKETMTGMPLETALRDMNRYIKSETLRRTVDLIIEGIRSGGRFASLLEETANDIRRVQVIKKEMGANVMMYIIFIFFAGCIGAPVLYSLSSFLIATITKLGSVSGFAEAGLSAMKMPFVNFGSVDLSPEFLFQFSIIAMLITTGFGGLIIGLISTGREKAGIKYIPVLVVLALVIYFATGFLIGELFGTLVPNV